MALQLYIGNKNYSSWSMRPWVLLKQTGIAFEERLIRFDSFAPDSKFKAELARLSPVGKVPVLVDDGFAIWDTLASPSTWPRNILRSSCGRRRRKRGPAPAASAPRCTRASVRCAAPAP
jgi:hypothetical protein